MVKVNSKSQKGRSMVEMLGVLAIIGVLSVGGVYGYGVAMKKHKANEALHKASMLATTVSAYAMSNDGNLPSTITDFANLGYYTELTDDGTQFKLTISGLDDGVCKQMQSSKGGIAQGVACDETTGNATITYYKNLATTEAEGEKSPTGGNSGGDTKPTCPTGTSTDGSGGYAVSLADGGMCRCETSGTVYKDGTCESKGDDNTCSSYADCDKGEYCQFSPGENCTTDPTSGTCKPVSDCGMYPINIDDGHDYKASDYGGSCKPDWWTAKDICASMGMRMPTLADVGCEGSKDGNCPTSGTVYGELAAKGLKYSFWTTDMYDSCSAWYVDFGSDGYVYYDVRFNPNFDFLCVR